MWFVQTTLRHFGPNWSLVFRYLGKQCTLYLAMLHMCRALIFFPGDDCGDDVAIGTREESPGHDPCSVCGDGGEKRRLARGLAWPFQVAAARQEACGCGHCHGRVGGISRSCDSRSDQHGDAFSGESQRDGKERRRGGRESARCEKRGGASAGPECLMGVVSCLASPHQGCGKHHHTMERGQNVLKGTWTDCARRTRRAPRHARGCTTPNADEPTARQVPLGYWKVSERSVKNVQFCTGALQESARDAKAGSTQHHKSPFKLLPEDGAVCATTPKRWTKSAVTPKNGDCLP